MRPELSHARLEQAAKEHGIHLLGVSAISLDSQEAARLKQWQKDGNSADMQYMQRDSDMFVTARTVLPTAAAVLVCALEYTIGHAEQKCPTGYARVARYAWGRDYHRVIKKRLKKCMESIVRSEDLVFEYRIVSDSIPLLERSFAKQAGLGFVGKNTMLIRPGVGSFFFLAEVVLSVPVQQSALHLLDTHCSTCVRCLNACPTGAFESPFVLDARKCISYLTIEKRGDLSLWERRALGNWVFGCDICQEVCPFNHRGIKEESKSPIAEFAPADYIQDGAIALNQILSIDSDEEFLRLFAGTPLMRAKRQGLIRNACCVVANTGAVECLTHLERCYFQEADPLIRQYALYAVSALLPLAATTEKSRIRKVLKFAQSDSALQVQVELARITAELSP